jgi:nucleolar protein 56
VAGAVLVRGGRRLFLISPDGAVLRQESIGADVATAADSANGGWTGAGDSAIARIRGAAPAGGSIASPDPELQERAVALGWSVTLLDPEAARPALSALPTRPIPHERAWLLARAHLALLRAAADPEEQLIALAREEERTERSLDREVGAASAWISEGSPSLGEHANSWKDFRDEFARHHAVLRARVERAARASVPNLSEVVGPRVAARLVAAANGRATLARMTAGRLQLLGSRRRPGAHGPRYGVIFGALRGFDPPPARTAAFARSLAALAAIAVKADASTQRWIAPELVRRRERRLAWLRREGR